MIVQAIIKDGGIFIPDLHINSNTGYITVNVDILSSNDADFNNKFNKYFGTWKDTYDEIDLNVLSDQRKIDKELWHD
ncbi:MAG: hypothetical protein A2015_03925 [Spirochaetes bacterium GWF1_31_7]|nr:MAG: hypothetical protein A2Y29_00730 [Spirochaetes bacterium GWE2_31_10]OHD51343.1 MAG: hypothetical protein A2015_03925 [Spirochaetes bacterium GWF1_31_7]OHD78082.1 MAG: hypothetical protein A2355_11870 [Spirochaetes bacterium RIFOXYB1_FULL_32_8]HBD96403.1 hypothetical protein [Spirochaetia bacterium]HBI39224.1 hypothetical protein [Spirochaetia bacterium]